MNSSDLDVTIAAERRIARQFIGRFQWEMVLIGLGQFTLWLAVFVAGIQGALPLWAGFPIALVCCCFAYLPSHEAQHGNIAGKNERLKWLNELVGHVSLSNLCYPYRFAQATHMRHHAFTNDPDRDTDYHYSGPHWWHAARGVHRDPPQEILELHMNEDPVFAQDLAASLPVKKLFSLLMLICAVAWPLPTFFLWWLPSRIALSYTTVFFAWMPHHPADQQERYQLARFWRLPMVPRFAVQSMTHHAIHHLYPRIPHWSQPQALKALRPFIEAHEMRGAEILQDYR
ncbi:MAG: fatty acid desaturase [Candidatus Binatia bacterium]|nr:fatty acid desaturase [Candidatus Binatia bacterium]MDG1959962.1 fatty acid desaturase [Candidatus Binatia bacterium]MDG2009977.1 fatty acid desaturase [Candidatus Binatia bacterium]